MSLSTYKLGSGLSAVLLIFSAQVVSAQEGGSKAAKNRAEIDTDATAIITEFQGMKGGKAQFDKAAGYAVFKVTKGGFGAPGAGGRGVAVGSAGVGLTFGVSRYDVVILFETPEKFASFSKGGWDSAATAQAAAGTKGKEVSSTFFDGVAYYQLGKRGLMASADVSGTRFWVADELNKK